MAKVTSSADRSKRAARSKAKVSGKTPSSRANRSAVSTAKVTSSADRSKRAARSKATVSGKTPSSRANRSAVSTAKVTTAKRNLTRVAVGVGKGIKALSGLRALAPAAVAMETLKARPTAEGTLTSALKRGDYKPRQGPSVPKRLTQGGMNKGSFNSAFKASRAAGKKIFSWRGKKYTTKIAGE